MHTNYLPLIRKRGAELFMLLNRSTEDCVDVLPWTVACLVSFVFPSIHFHYLEHFPVQ